MLSPEMMGRLSQRLLSDEMKARLQHFHFEDVGHGFDAFGLHPSAIHLGIGLFAWIYESYFRVISKGAEHIPEFGSAILAANHSGNIPIDAMMLWNDVLRQTEPPRVARGIADHFVPALPFIGTLFSRAGMVGGSAGNVRSLLDKGELLMIFPEGVPGIIKPWEDRYQLQTFRVGHAQMAIQHSCPIIPIGIVGAEEQLPSLYSSKRLGKVLALRRYLFLWFLFRYRFVIAFTMVNLYQFMSDMRQVRPTIQMCSKRWLKRLKRLFMNLYSKVLLIE